MFNNNSICMALQRVFYNNSFCWVAKNKLCILLLCVLPAFRYFFKIIYLSAAVDCYNNVKYLFMASSRFSGT